MLPTQLVLQGVSLSADRRFCRTASVPQSHPCLLAKPFLQLSNNFQPLIYRQSSSYLSLRSYKRTISAEAEKKGWDFGRFIKTLYFFNGPPSPAKVGVVANNSIFFCNHFLSKKNIFFYCKKKIFLMFGAVAFCCFIWHIFVFKKYLKFFDFLVEKLSGPSPSEPVKSMDTSGIVLVAGATGGVGRRVVDVLRKKGLPVRVLVIANHLLIYVILLWFWTWSFKL